MTYQFHPAAEAEFLEWQVEAHPDIRRVPLRRFPLSIIYRESSVGFQVLAVAHDRRRPQYWLKRR